MTRDELAAQLRELGVRPGAVLMVHTRMSALGRVEGAQDTVVTALLDALGPEGTLTAYASWDEAGPWDPETSAATPENGRIPERIRTWPGARRSLHAEASVVAVGARAEEVTAAHDPADGYGARTPFAHVEEVLMLGAPLETLTLVHHAEALVDLPGKRTVSYEVDGERFTDIDTTEGAFDYGSLGLDADYVEVVAREALAAGCGVSGRVGPAECHLFDASRLTAFALAWLQARFSPA